jgi:MoaA/NifB/PqqE/SkfB family radical SAM enzyme
MRFPLALTAKIARHIISHKIRRTPKFAMVLQLEPLHTCNLTCTGCGRIREYSTSLKDMVPLADCLQAARDCDAPMVSICGGEPLIYPKIEELVAGLRAQGRIIYICTNGMFMRKKMREYMAAHYSPEMETRLQKLVTEKLVTEQEAAQIRAADAKARQKATIVPSQWLYWNVHVDGLEYTHDLIVEREGVFKECIAAIRMAKLLGYQTATNTTVYRESDVRELEDMFKYLSSLNVDGHTISPGYDYDAAKKDMAKRLGKDPKEFFLTREMTREKFQDIERWGQAFTIFGTPVYQEFLAGKRELTCTAWAIPTYNVKGWRGGRRGARSALRKLHGALRLRSQRRAGHKLPARRQLEELQIQLLAAAATVPGQRGTGATRVQRREHRQGTPGRGEGRHQRRRLPDRRKLAGRTHCQRPGQGHRLSRTRHPAPPGWLRAVG